MHTSSKDYFAFGARITLLVLAGLLPIWFVPYPIGIESGREITFAILISGALILWLLSLLTRGEIRYSHSPILWAGAFLVFIFGISTFFSQSPFLSLALAGPIGERLSTIAFAFLLMFLAGSVLRSWQEASVGLWILFASSGIAALLTLVQLLFDVSPWRWIVSFAGGRDFNIFGSINGFTLFLAVIAATQIGVLLSSASAGIAAWRRALLGVSIFLHLAVIFVVNFPIAWMVFLGAVIVLWGFLIKDMRGVRVGAQRELGTWNSELGTEKAGSLTSEGVPSTSSGNNNERREASKLQAPKFDWRYATALGLVAFSLFMVIVRTSLGPELNLPAEVSPTLTGTWNVSRQVLREGPQRTLFGSGPGTFGFSWAQYKDSAINQTQFWAVRFNQGSSWFSTLISTVGVLGVLAFLGFLGTALFVFLRPLLASHDPLMSETEKSPYPIGVIAGIAALALSVFLYPANLSLIVLLFLMIGWMGVLVRVRQTQPSAGESSELGVGSSEQTEVSIPEEERLPEGSVQAGKFGDRSLEFGAQTETAAPISQLSSPNFWDVRERVIQFMSPWSLFLSSLAGILALALGISSLYFQIGRARSAFVVQRGVALLNEGRTDDALIRFDRAIAYEEKNPQNHLAFVQASVRKIQELIQRASRQENVQQEFQAAVAAAVSRSRSAADLLPQEPIVWRAQGGLYELVIPFIDGAYNAAVASYARAAELDPLNPLSHVDTARAGLVFADRVAFISSQAPQESRAQIQKAYADALEGARLALKKAIEIKSDLAGAHFLMTQVAIRSGNLPDAISSAEQARAGAPFDLGVAFQLGLLYYQTERYDFAQGEFERALAISENYSNARYFLGLILDRKGEKEKAVGEFEKIEALNPDNQEVKRILENLRSGKPALEEIAPPAQPPEKRTAEPVEEEKR